MFKKSIWLFMMATLWVNSVKASVQLACKDKCKALVYGYIRKNSSIEFPDDLVRSVVKYFDADENYKKTIVVCYQLCSNFKDQSNCYFFAIPPEIACNKALLEDIIGSYKFPNKQHKFAYVKKCGSKGRMFYIGKYCYIGKRFFNFYDKKGNKLVLEHDESTFLHQMLNLCYEDTTFLNFFQSPQKSHSSTVEAIEIIANKIIYQKYSIDLLKQKMKHKGICKQLLMSWRKLVSFGSHKGAVCILTGESYSRNSYLPANRSPQNTILQYNIDHSFGNYNHLFGLLFC